MAKLIGRQALNAIVIVTAMKVNLMLQESRVGKQQRRRQEQDGTPIQGYVDQGLHGREKGGLLSGYGSGYGSDYGSNNGSDRGCFDALR